MKQKIILGGGCFWGTQAFFDHYDWITYSEVGYANGIKDFKVTYEEVCSGTTGFVEVCLLEFDDTKIDLKTLLSHYWNTINPTTLNRQGNDIGSQYRSGIYYFDEFKDIQLKVIIDSKNKLAQDKNIEVVTEILPLKNYVTAEDYHQKYLDKNPGGYCHINLNQAWKKSK
ncbi:peptide-methionine (S)-S-oxide reductase [Spiroplasma sp. TIUS-1]|uniref:peptide-methionine (S)-S-oxide reductase MsrA n=1 Tax=Spiroplasma sp. TIUS-1 TaxID=216963 RepID=UPI0013990CE6|nr:peptide-methionine (S)-S-oxide reductase MsrA [Spiroplasma sp. TIUS-1]QHX35766.1 peptide-methionine (S)-S-oxide reductase [Spiroplasma sp. TIUS-1]